MDKIGVPPASTILSAHSLSAIASAPDPLSWDVSLFARDLNTPEAGLEAFRSANVTDITCYHRKSGVTHEYLLLKVVLRSQQEVFGSRLWMRCERRPGPVSGSAMWLSKDSPPAMDSVRLSYDRTKLCNNQDDTVVMQSSFDSLKLEHVADLLNTIHEVSPNYGLASFNCWWFAAVTIGALQIFGQDWTIPPSRDWTKLAVKAMGRDTTSATNAVTKRFVQKWTSKSAAYTSVSAADAWENRDVHPKVELKIAGKNDNSTSEKRSIGTATDPPIPSPTPENSLTSIHLKPTLRRTRSTLERLGSLMASVDPVPRPPSPSPTESSSRLHFTSQHMSKNESPSRNGPPIGHNYPPYAFDPNRTYRDPAVQAWADYYANGGTDPCGLAYFEPSTLAAADDLPGYRGEEPDGVRRKEERRDSKQHVNIVWIGLQKDKETIYQFSIDRSTPLNELLRQLESHVTLSTHGSQRIRMFLKDGGHQTNLNTLETVDRLKAGTIYAEEVPSEKTFIDVCFIAKGPSRIVGVPFRFSVYPDEPFSQTRQRLYGAIRKYKGVPYPKFTIHGFALIRPHTSLDAMRLHSQDIVYDVCDKNTAIGVECEADL